MTPNETSPDQAVEAVARAMHADVLATLLPAWMEDFEGERDYWMDLARTAIAAIPTPPPACPSCLGLNTSCPDGCGRDPTTGELNGSTPPPADHTDLIARLDKVYNALTPGAIDIADLDGMAFTVADAMAVLQAHASPREVEDKPSAWLHTLNANDVFVSTFLSKDQSTANLERQYTGYRVSSEPLYRLKNQTWSCAARGSVGANEPQECDYPECGCDPDALQAHASPRELEWEGPLTDEEQAMLDAAWEKHKAADPVCRIPPEAWYCTRAPGHDGPCAAHPTRTALDLG